MSRSDELTAVASAVLEERLKKPKIGEDHPTKCYMRDGEGEPGEVTGSVRRCQMAGCNGVRIMVRWPNGKVTWPCSRGLQTRRDGAWQIM